MNLSNILTYDRTITLPKYGSFSCNLLLSRPYFLTYELLDRVCTQKQSLLRIVPASELHADTIAEEDVIINSEQLLIKNSLEYDLAGTPSENLMRSNRNIIDSASRQTLTMTEIEELKKQSTGAGKDLIEKLISSHVGIEEKSSFSFAKYKLLKTKKYLKRFTVLPVDVPHLTQWMVQEKNAAKIMEIREEMLALIGSWANVHFSSIRSCLNDDTDENVKPSGRWLVVDETGGLLVASIAERMGILYPKTKPMSPEALNFDKNSEMNHDLSISRANTITLVHNNTQPNLSLLKYFSFLPDNQNASKDNTKPPHPLSVNLFLINWLQLLNPSQDTTYATPITRLSVAELSAMKSSRQETYHRKQRRWARAKYVVAQTQAGGFDGLAVMSQMDPVSILKPLLPLLKGGAQVCVYSPYIEPLVTLADVFSTSRRTAFIHSQLAESSNTQCAPILNTSLQAQKSSENQSILSSETGNLNNTTNTHTNTDSYTTSAFSGSSDFPLNPTILLNSTIQSARTREWQILPGRTHPIMTGRGGAEGYLFTAVRVLPAQGHVEARGNFSRKRVANEQKEVVGKRFKSQQEI